MTQVLSLMLLFLHEDVVVARKQHERFYLIEASLSQGGITPPREGRPDLSLQTCRSIMFIKCHMYEYACVDHSAR